jgi:hypothetical protein
MILSRRRKRYGRNYVRMRKRYKGYKGNYKS